MSLPPMLIPACTKGTEESEQCHENAFIFKKDKLEVEWINQFLKSGSSI